MPSWISMWMAWGPELTFFCNDAYRRDTLGNTYPWALGRPASGVWAEIWSDVESGVNRVLGTRSRVLLADDNPDLRRYLKRLFEPDWEVTAWAMALKPSPSFSARPLTCSSPT